MPREKVPTVPRGLGKSGRELWKRVVREFSLEQWHLILLEQCCASLDRVEEARAILDQDGVVVKDRWGQPREHPAVNVELANRRLLRSLLRELGLDVVAGLEEYARSPRTSTRGRKKSRR